MARAKRASDELYNARRRARRAAERAERSGDEARARELRAAVAQSYGVRNVGATLATLANVTARNVRPTEPAPVQVRREPREKRASDELYNARRRMRREAERMEREARGMTGAARDAALDFARNLREQARAGKKLTAAERESTIKRLSEVFEQARRTRDMRVARSNLIWMQQINAAGTEGADSSISERKKDVFWAAVKGLWPKGSYVPRNERYDRILDHFYNEDTTDAREFRVWLRDAKGVDPRDVYGSLQYVYEYVTEKLNDPSVYDLPEMPYASVMDLVRTAM